MEILNKLSQQKIVNQSLIIRHANRDAIPKGQFGADVMLNQKGKENAKIFGEKLQKYDVHKIYTSPVGRCVQTAEIIRQNYNKNIDIEQTKILGNPGVFIFDAEKAGKMFLKLELLQTYKMLINNEPFPGMRTISEGSKILENFVNQNRTKTGLNIFITHDYFIAFLEYFYDKKIYENKVDVDFLNGIIL